MTAIRIHMSQQLAIKIRVEAKLHQLIERVLALKIEEIKRVDMDCCVVVG